MTTINIVYRNNNMPADVLPPISASDGTYSVVWSRHPQPGCDVAVYFNHYTFNRRMHERICPSAVKLLYLYEPPAIDPMQYTKVVWRKFDAVLTWNTYLTGASPFFIFEAGAYYDLPYCSDYGITPLEAPPDLTKRERAICQICGDKYSPVAEELYSQRRRMARWFHENAKTRMDVYGNPPMAVPNYRGVCADKAATLSRYRYALCFENTFHPIWTRGYLTEKILDCMAAGTIPVYCGCSNIEELVPTDCFIDYREISSLHELDERLQSMGDEEYLGYVQRMRAFIGQVNAPYRYSAFRLYETVARWVREDLPRRKYPIELPPDYIDLGTLNSRLRFEAMRLLLPCYRYADPLFSILRCVKKGVGG